MPTLFCNVGWMEHYDGLQSNDQIQGGGAFVRREGRGHEVCNFSKLNGSLYGYVQTPAKHVNLNRLGAMGFEASISGVTVVWTATRPGGGTVIVGWYENATLFRELQVLKNPSPIHVQNTVDGYRMVANEANTKLLSLDARTFEIPRRTRGGMGQSNIWYCDSPDSLPLLKRVHKFIRGNIVTRATRIKLRNSQDQDRKIKVEKIAIGMCIAHYENLGYEVVSVEKDNVGWDLEAKSAKVLLRIEVKGLSCEEFSVELTPNEYEAFVAVDMNYRLVVVTAALENPILSICRYSKEKAAWIIENDSGKFLQIKEKKSASIVLR